MAVDRHELRVFFDAKIPMCACGNPEEGVKLIYDVLKLHPLYAHREELRALLPTTGIEMVVLGLLEEAGLNEHGGGIGGSWLTPFGEQVRDALQRELDEHPDDESPFDSFCDSHCIHGFFADTYAFACHKCKAGGDPVIPGESSDGE